MHDKKITVALLFFPLLLLAFLVGEAVARAPEQLPDFALPSATDGGVVDSNHHRGKILLINFWATWCGPCREEIPALIALQNEYGEKGFSVIGISMDDSKPKYVNRFLKKMAVNYPVAMGNGKTARAFGGIIGVPKSFLVDRQGKIVQSYTGLVGKPTLEKDIDRLVRSTSSH